jgi:hypothetical protein
MLVVTSPPGGEVSQVYHQRTLGIKIAWDSIVRARNAWVSTRL